MPDRYETTFGTEWAELSTDETIERAFAIGVAETLEEAPPDELARLYE